MKTALSLKFFKIKVCKIKDGTILEFNFSILAWELKVFKRFNCFNPYWALKKIKNVFTLEPFNKTECQASQGYINIVLLSFFSLFFS